MQKIYHLLKSHIQEDFHAAYYGIVLLFLAVSIAINYGLGVNLYLWDITYEQHSFWAIPASFVFYALPFFFCVGLYSYFYKDTSFWYKEEFWVKVLVLLLIRALVTGTWFHTLPLQDYAKGSSDYFWLFRTLMVGRVYVYDGLGLTLLYFLYEKEKSHFWGLTFQGFDWKPYGYLLAIMAVGVCIACFMGDAFVGYYPIMKPSRIESMTVVNPQVGFWLFEGFYASFYLWTEVFFRGLMVIGFTRLLGRHAIVPMVAVYVFLHFQKPMGETIGAIIAGYVLGVLAFRTRSIMGGVLVHAGVSFMMEIFPILWGFVKWFK